MAEFSRHIPEPVASLEELAGLLEFWNEEICKKEMKDKSFIFSVVLGTEGDDAGRNLVWFKNTNTPPLAPSKLQAFPITLSNEDRRKAVLDFESANKLEVRSSAIVLLGGEKKWVALFDPARVPAPVATPAPQTGTLIFRDTKARVSNKIPTPDAFLKELVNWGMNAPAEIFVDKPTREKDVYASVEEELGPYGDLLHRKACMLEVMRVLGGIESEWNWNDGIDRNTSSSKPRNEVEAGAWQVSSNSVAFGDDLKALVLREVGSTDAEAFQSEMKRNHPLAMEYIARLLRHTIRHNGPVKRAEINDFLSTAAVKEFQRFLVT